MRYSVGIDLGSTTTKAVILGEDAEVTGVAHEQQRSGVACHPGEPDERAIQCLAVPSIAQFRREEDGSLLIFGLFYFVMMLVLAGVALDLMRFEERRTQLQQTTDRAVLAAAGHHPRRPGAATRTCRTWPAAG